MIKSVKAYSRDGLIRHVKTLDFHDKQNIIVISLNDIDSSSPKELVDFKALALYFSDCRPLTTFKFPHYPLRSLSRKEAEYIVDYINLWHAQKDYQYDLLVHCHAGICRSGAVARFTQMVCELDERTFTAMNPNILPNDWVLDLLIQTHIDTQNEEGQNF